MFPCRKSFNGCWKTPLASIRDAPAVNVSDDNVITLLDSFALAKKVRRTFLLPMDAILPLTQ